MRSTLHSASMGAYCAVSLLLPPDVAGGQRTSPTRAADVIASPVGAPGATANQAPALAKLDPPLAAVARAWRRFGVRGAEQECALRNIPLDRLRVAAIIDLVTEGRRAGVEGALRRAWGEVHTVDETRLYVSLPVPAIRRMSRLSDVRSIYLDPPTAPVSTPPRVGPR